MKEIRKAAQEVEQSKNALQQAEETEKETKEKSTVLEQNIAQWKKEAEAFEEIEVRQLQITGKKNALAEIEDAVTDLNGAVATYMGEQAYGTKEDAPIDDPEDDPEEKPNGGCFGAITGMGALALLSATAVVVAVISKKKRN